MRTPHALTELEILTVCLVTCLVVLLHNGRTVEAFGYSYSRFIGPVRGPERQIIVRDRHDGTGRVDYVARPEYQFAYGVEDAKTRVLQNRRETRNGDAVKGVYSVVDPDGTLRVVKYTADNANGFQAEVISNGVSRIHGQDYPAVLQPPPQAVPPVSGDNQVDLKDNHHHQVEVHHPPAVEQSKGPADEGERQIPVHQDGSNDESSEGKDAVDYEDEDNGSDGGKPVNRDEAEEQDESDEEVEDY